MAGSRLGALGFGAERSHVAGSQGFEQTGLGSWSSRTRGFAQELLGFPGGSTAKNPPAVRKMQDRSLGWEDPLEAEMTTYSIILT